MSLTLRLTTLVGILFAVAVLPLAGCGSSSSMNVNAHAADASTEGKVELKTATWDQALELVAKNKGKIVVLDIWSSSCQPCVKEFPGLVKLQKNHPADVVCISFNCDFIGLGKPEDESAKVLEFLREQKAAFHNLLSSEADEAVFKKAKIAAPPVVQVYGRDGALAKQFDNESNQFGADGFTYDKDVSPYVAELMRKK
jgi:thiol-disulfide isomerase/thioredoxin